MKTFTFVFVTVLGLGFFHLLQASPIGKVSYSNEEAVDVVPSTESTTAVALSNITTVDTLTTEIDLTHKLMDKQAALIRQYESSSETTTTTEAPVVLSNAQIDAFGRPYSNIAFADFTNNIIPGVNPNSFYDQQQ
ncbi:hypothetical protein FO519_000137 [Halicephalobus sp. NKZ332]|nr:hypothetical protein FO519_000137 [Halicephalobus sp. NKZ332]